MVSTNWQAIRQLRSGPPAGIGEQRRNEFSAALEQAESLWRASRLIGTAASPLPRFYSLAQAGRAFLAASNPDKNRWRARHGHGLKMDDRQLGSPGTPTLDDVYIKSSGTGLFQQVSELLDSPTLKEGSSVGVKEILSKYPLWPIPVDTDSGDPGAVAASWGSAADRAISARLFIWPIPDRLVGREPQQMGSRSFEWPSITDEAALREWLSTFTTIRDIVPSAEIDRPHQSDLLDQNSPLGVPLWWKTVSELATTAGRHGHLDLTGCGPSNHEPHGNLFAPLAGCDKPLHPLMAAWLLLFALSNLCRYYPARWVNLVDVDSSLLAVPLESVVAPDDEIVPSLILSAFRCESPARLRI